MPLKRKFLLLIAILFSTTIIFAQQNVFVKAKEKGNGILKTRSNECFAIAPNHVIDGYSGDITVLSTERILSYANFIESYPFDLAVARIEKRGTQKCDSWNVSNNFNAIINGVSDGFLEYIDELGTSNLIQVAIKSKDQQSLSIIPSNNVSFSKGMSGSSLYIKHQNEKILLGMLMSIENDLHIGHVLRIDIIDKIVSSFFKTAVKKKIGIVLLRNDLEDAQITNSMVTELNKGNTYEAKIHFKDKNYIKKNFNNIISGGIEKKYTKKFKGNIEELLLGKVTVTEELNERNLYNVRSFMEVHIFTSDTFTLLKAVTVFGRGLDYNKTVAAHKSYKSLLTNLKKEMP